MAYAGILVGMCSVLLAQIVQSKNKLIADLHSAEVAEQICCMPQAGV